MAIALEKLEDQLNCSICLETYTNPKQLQCHHVYCRNCLVKLVYKDQQGQLSLTCPNCRQITPVPANGVSGLQAAFQINKLLEIVDEHKKGAGSTVSASSSEISSSSPQESITVLCPEHGDKEVELFCETCQETICWKCIKKGSKHQTHDYDELGEAFERYKGETLSSLEPMKKQLVAIQEALTVMDNCHDEISQQESVIEAKIHNTIDGFHKALDERKSELVSQLHQLTRTKLNCLAAQKEQIEITQAQLSSCISFIEETIKTVNQGEVLTKKNTTIRQVKELTTTFKEDILKPNAKADIVFSALSDFILECRRYGEVSTSGHPDPSKCYASGEGLEAAIVGEKCTVTVQALDSDDQPWNISTAPLSCQLVSMINGTTVNGNIERRGPNEYEISYQPTIKGRHMLHIEVKDRSISGSPFPLNITSPAESFSTPIVTTPEIRVPFGIAVNNAGEMVVTEWRGNCVSVFSPSGELQRSFGTYGSSQGQFNSPCGVAVDKEDNILVADHKNHRIQKFTASGEFLAAVGSRQSPGPHKFYFPIGIAVNASSGRVYVSSRNDHIQILNSDLSHFSSFGTSGNGKGAFCDPHHIACDRIGNVYVADTNNHRLQVFTADGSFLRMLHGYYVDDFKLPHYFGFVVGVAIDSNGKIYVSDRGNECVSVFNSEGQFVTSFGRKGEGKGEFQSIGGLAVDHSGVVYVCDSGNRCVKLF